MIETGGKTALISGRDPNEKRRFFVRVRRKDTDRDCCLCMFRFLHLNLSTIFLTFGGNAHARRLGF